MQANPDKFQAIAVGQKTISRSPIFDLDGFSISCDEVVKLLGVDIDCKLKFDSHVPAVRTTSYGKNSFKYAAPKLWNSLPDHFRTCSSFSKFKTLISSWSGKDCKCIACDSG
ncbi:hypothetical protein DPMN_172150 [Dreissena polymorpha]|uniref:Uncharacterized protein n=1 Tax=Dreissena polymorpha TaxID=45954 RepID=A0A9D4IG94_DREPO|nr:hypothetical protein DPMN_172150 [Dreissena polymorpha]